MFAADPADQVNVEGHVGEYLYRRQGTREARTPFVLSLDPSRLPTALADVTALGKPDE